MRTSLQRENAELARGMTLGRDNILITLCVMLKLFPSLMASEKKEHRKEGTENEDGDVNYKIPSLAHAKLVLLNKKTTLSEQYPGGCEDCELHPSAITGSAEAQAESTEPAPNKYIGYTGFVAVVAVPALAYLAWVKRQYIPCRRHYSSPVLRIVP